MDEFNKYSELYYLSKVRYFKEADTIPKEKYRLSKRHPNIEDADIVAFGSSCSDYCRYVSFPERISKRLNKKVHFIREAYPLHYFNKSGYVNDSAKLCIYEIVERNIPAQFDQEQTPSFSWEKNDTWEKSYKKLSIARKIEEMIFRQNSEQYYRLLLMRGYFVSDIYEFFATKGLDWFKYMAKEITYYNLNYNGAAWAFYYKQFEGENSFYYMHPDSDIDRYCTNMKKLRDQLWSKYHLETIFVLIPNKYSVYYDVINKDDLKNYNDLLNKVQLGLDELNIPVVNLLRPFRDNHDKLLFYRTDPHWNTNGVQIATDETVDLIKKRYYENSEFEKY